MTHLAMNTEGDVLEVEITDTDTETGDSSGLDLLLPQVGEIDRLIADTAYYQIERNELLITEDPPRSFPGSGWRAPDHEFAACAR